MASVSMMNTYDPNAVQYGGQEFPSEPAKASTFQAAALQAEGPSSLAAAAALIYRQQQRIAAKTSMSSSAPTPCAPVTQAGDTLDEVLQLKQGSVTSLYGKLRSSVVPAAAQQALSALSPRPAWLQHHGTAASSQGHAAVPAGALKAAPALQPAHDAAAAAAAVSLGPACSASHLTDVPSPEVLNALLATAKLACSDREEGVPVSSACNLPSHGGTQGSSSIIPAMLQQPTPAAAAVLSPGSVDAMFLAESRAQWLQQLQAAPQRLPTAPMPGGYAARAPALGHDASLSVLDCQLRQLQVGGLNLSGPAVGSLNPPGLEMPCFAESTAGVAAAGMVSVAGSYTGAQDYAMMGLEAAGSSMQHLQQHFAGQPQLTSHVAAAAAATALGGSGSSFQGMAVQPQLQSVLLYGPSTISGSGCCLGGLERVPGFGSSLSSMTAVAGQQLLLAASPVGSNSSSATGSQLFEHRAHKGAGNDLHCTSHHGAHNPLYKTEMCRSWQDSGSCRYGGRCQFAHGAHELRPLMRHPKYRTQPCRTFSLTGSCPYGDRCTFIHDLAPSLNLVSLGGSCCILQNQGATAALAT